MLQFKEFVNEGVSDVEMLKKKPLDQRTPREQAAINAAKITKPKPPKVEIQVKHEDGSISKERFKLTSKDHESEAKKIAADHLKHMQSIHDKFPGVSKSRAQEVHKVVIK